MRTDSTGRARGRAITRRNFLGLGASVALCAAMPAWARARPGRSLAFHHLHTGEQLAVTYFDRGSYDDIALAAINHLLRDFRTGEIHPIRRTLLDQLAQVHAVIGSDAPFEVISGYRSPATNDMLHRTTSGVATRSLHMDGMAIDVRLADTKTRKLRDVAAGLALGGVGYYAASDFVHLDIGRVRHW